MRQTALLLFFLLLLAPPAHAGDNGSLWSNVDMEWNGHLKNYGRALFPEPGSAFQEVGLGTNFDGFTELRLINKTFFKESAYTEIHWEGVLAGGGTREDGERLKRLYPALYPNGLVAPPSDDRRLVDLTGVIHEDRGAMLYHRLDRAMLALTPEWGEVRLGRQAATWGHGFTFNPMDLFNPFAPTDLERDYKVGDDMALVQFPATVLERDVDVELIYVARRDPSTKDADFEQASTGGKLHFQASENTGVDLIAARHYEDTILGAGAVGYIGDAAWRFDTTATFLDDPSRGRWAYLSAVANMDYSWIWFEKNWYGYVELYYNGLSDADYGDHFSDTAIAERIARGELYALGSLYWSGHLNCEIHPLLNLYLTAIVNLNDPSGVWLPRAVYDMSDNLRLTLSGSFSWGAQGTEYGGYDIPGYPFDEKPADSVSAWLTWYF
ncbi:hypothetical protein [Salidesulfovibrio onnuriiensis]|uniref:hypothetical protein n=1 Tax=Salidesulfovibrio onnuriiensis TaxID=2583823 RepID=UPI0011C96A3F|nr:hypothetical protein [Salidesulfovibrio onnuriiensis]